MLDYHPFANIFPMMSSVEFEGLKEDLRENGLMIVIDMYEGKILDGRNRYRGCLEVGIEPRFRNFQGTREEAMRYVISSNMKRRHLTPSQIAVISLEFLPLYEELARERQRGGQGGVLLSANLHQASGKSADKVAEAFNISGRLVGYAREIQQLAPDKLEEIKSGKESIHKVLRDVLKQEFVAQTQKRANEKGIVVKNIYQGDSAEILKTLPDNSIDVLVCDPPWGVSFSDVSNQHNEPFQDDKTYALEILDRVCGELKRVCKPDAHLYFFFGISNYHEVRQILEKHFFKVDKVPLIWCKPNFPLGRDLNKSHAVEYEPIFFCKNRNGNRYFNYSVSHTVLQFDNVQGKVHATQKPVELLKHLIANSTVENETVCDPFMGSGSTIVASIELKRQYIGIELSREYFDIATARISEAEELRLSENPEQLGETKE